MINTLFHRASVSAVLGVGLAITSVGLTEQAHATIAEPRVSVALMQAKVSEPGGLGVKVHLAVCATDERTARKRHRCPDCRGWIEPGQRYADVALPPDSETAGGGMASYILLRAKTAFEGDRQEWLLPVPRDLVRAVNEILVEHQAPLSPAAKGQASAAAEESPGARPHGGGDWRHLYASRFDTQRNRISEPFSTWILGGVSAVAVAVVAMAMAGEPDEGTRSEFGRGQGRRRAAIASQVDLESRSRLLVSLLVLSSSGNGVSWPRPASPGHSPVPFMGLLRHLSTERM